MQGNMLSWQPAGSSPLQDVLLYSMDKGGMAQLHLSMIGEWTTSECDDVTARKIPWSNGHIYNDPLRIYNTNMIY